MRMMSETNKRQEIKSAIHVAMKSIWRKNLFLIKKSEREKVSFNFQRREKGNAVRAGETLSLILGIKSLNGNPDEQMGQEKCQ